MAEGVERSEWERWSLALAMFANVNRKPGASPIPASTFNPYEIADRNGDGSPGLDLDADSTRALGRFFAARKRAKAARKQDDKGGES